MDLRTRPMVRRCSMPFRAFLHATGLLLCVWMPAHAWQPEVLHTVTILALHPEAMSTHIYKGRYTNSSDILYTWDGKHLYSGRYTSSSEVLYTWDGQHLYRGRYTNSSDVQFTFDGKHLYKGRYTNSSDILYTWDGKHLYKGRYTNSSDIVLTVDGSVPAWLLVVVT